MFKNKQNQQTECARIVQEAIDGSTSAFEQLYRQTHRRLLMYCWRIAKNESLAEELLQESYIKAWQALPEFRMDSQFYTWLRTIASRLLIDRLRLKSEKVWLNQADLDFEQSGYTQSIGESIDLERQIGMLPDGARSVFVMHDIEGYSHREISKMMNIAEGTSKAQLTRARQLVRKQLVASTGEKEG